MATLYMSPEAPDPKAWLIDRLRRTNWAAAGIAALLQAGFLAMLILMGVVTVAPEVKREKSLITIAFADQPKPAAPAPQPEAADKPVVQPKAEMLAPPAKIQISNAPPVAAAAQKVPDQPTPSQPVAAAPAPAAAAPAAETGPLKVANLTENRLNCPKPVFPPKARFEHQEGRVVVQIVLSTGGRVTEASVRRSSGFNLLDEAALASARQCRGSPTMRDGRPVEITGPVLFNLTLTKS